MYSDTAIEFYPSDEFNVPKYDAEIIFNGQGVNIEWKISAETVIVFEKDSKLLLTRDAKNIFRFRTINVLLWKNSLSVCIENILNFTG